MADFDFEHEDSLDDILENERSGGLQYDIGQQALPEDNDSPAAPDIVDGESPLDDTHPSLDTDVDADERYQGF